MSARGARPRIRLESRLPGSTLRAGKRVSFGRTETSQSSFYEEAIKIAHNCPGGRWFTQVPPASYSSVPVAGSGSVVTTGAGKPHLLGLVESPRLEALLAEVANAGFAESLQARGAEADR